MTSILLREVTDPIQKLTKEEQIESLLNFSDLEDKNLDWISRLRNLRHTNQFRKMDAVHKWEFKAINEDTEELNPNSNLQDKLDLLNNLQQKFDLARFDLYRSIENLYLDWNYYVDYLFRSSHYNLKLDSNRIQSILRNKSIPQVKSKQLYVARYNSSINQLKQDIESIALDQGRACILQSQHHIMNHYHQQ